MRGKNRRPIAAGGAVPFAIAMLGMLVAILWTPTASAATHGKDGRGKQMFRFCGGCHSLIPGENRIGPNLSGLFGRRAGGVAGYAYSRALSQSSILWNEQSLDLWLAGPAAMVPGTRMRFSGIRDEAARKALIAYLRQVTQPD